MIAHNKISEYNTSGTRTSDTLAFAPNGTPRAILLLSGHGSTNIDRIPDGNVTYGGVNMPRIQFAQDTEGEVGNVYAFFLGASIPTGNQDCVVTYNASNATSITHYVIEISGADDIEVIDSDVVQGDVDDPSIALTVGGRNCLAYSILFSGLDDIVANIDSGTGVTMIQGNDFGTSGLVVGMQSSVSTSDFTFGWTTSAADDVAMIAVSLSELEAPAAPSFAFVHRRKHIQLLP